MHIEVLRKEDKALFQSFINSIKEDFLPRREQNKQQLEKYFSNDAYHLLILKENNCIIGYIAYSKQSDNRIRIIGIGIDKNNRGKELSKKLMRHAMQEIKSFQPTSIYARTWESNEPSQALLKGFGFKEYRRTMNDRVNGEATVWLRRT